VVPVVCAPMTDVSGPELVEAACTAGVIGAFPVHNAGSIEELGGWLAGFETRLDPGIHAPWAANLVVHRTNARLRDELDCLIAHPPELVITSVGSPEPVVESLHAIGAQVWSDVASLRHVDRALEAGADGLILLTAGAGGKSGWANPFAFARAARERFDGPMTLAGGIADGIAARAALALGCDLAYMGTRFIATQESLASAEYCQLLVDSSLDEVVLTDALSGLPANVLRTSPGFQDLFLDGAPEEFTASRVFEARGRGIYSCGHSVSGVHSVLRVRDLVNTLVAEYRSQSPDTYVGEGRVTDVA
jgi:nitronate monooxygenase